MVAMLKNEFKVIGVSLMRNYQINSLAATFPILHQHCQREDLEILILDSRLQ